MIEGFISVPGGKVYYRQYGKLDSNAPLILVHGGPGFCHDTLRVLDPLAEERAIIFYDQLGCGASDNPKDDTLWTLSRYVEELESVINYFNLDSYHLLGHSFGASIVLEHASKQPSTLQSIIFSSPLISVSDWLKDANIRKSELPTKIQKAIDEHEANGTTDSKEYKAATKVFNKNFLCRLDPKPDLYIKAFKKFNFHIYNLMWGPSEFNCTGRLASYEGGKALEKLYYPVLLLCGAYDEAREETLKSYQKRLPSASLHVFKNSSHNTYLEDTDEYIEVAKKFHFSVESKHTQDKESNCSSI